MLKRWYRLTPRSRLVTAGGARLLECGYPLQRYRLNESAWLLLQALQSGAALDEAARPLSPAVIGFLEDKVTRGALAVRYAAVPPVLLPRVEVVIPVLDNAVGLLRCLAGVAKLDYPPQRLRVTVVDDGSRPAVRDALAQPPPAVPGLRWLRLASNVGPASARNAAWEDAPSVPPPEVCAFLDADCVPEPDWLRVLVSVLEEPGVAAAGGAVLGLHPRGWLGRYEQACSSLVLGGVGGAVGGAEDRYAYLPTCNLAVRAEALRSSGGFTPGLRVGEDVDLCWRLIAAGHGLFYFPGGAVRHQFRERVAPFLRRKLDYASSEAWLRRQHPAHFSGRTRWVFRTALLGGLGAAASAGWLGLAGASALLCAEAAVHAHHQAGAGTQGLRVGLRTLLPALARRAGSGVLAEARGLVHGWLAPGLLALALLLPWVPAPGGAGLWGLGMVMLAGAGEWLAKRPRLRWWEFAAGYLLDCLGYSAGRMLGAARGAAALRS